MTVRQRTRRGLTIRARMTLSVALLTMVVVLVVAAVQFLALRSFLTLAEHERLEQLVPEVQATLSAQEQRGKRAPLDLSSLPRSIDIRVLEGTRVLAQSEGFPAIPLSERPGYRPIANHNVLIRPVTVNGRPATAQIASDLLGVVHPLTAYLRALAITAPAATLLAALLSFALAGQLLRPLAELERAAGQVGEGENLRGLLPGTDRSDELGRLAQTLQMTFAQLADVREREEQFTRAAAHDLRSPLSALKTRLQGSLSGPRTETELREDIREALADVERMRRLTDHLLLLARGSRALHLLPLDLARLAGEVVDRVRERFPDVRLEFATEGQTVVLGDETLMTHVIQNLLDNGLRYGGGAEMRLTVKGVAGTVCLTVCDDGPGVPEAALPHLAEAFYRADEARGGAGNGLGLAIVHSAAQAHGARLHFEGVRPHGLRVLLDFPAVGAPTDSS
ncbi:sensor histidine kinase [Deinococcus ruber]|uniref:histidine kinase n=1 Tax=Deinococcus ruber TaxID=1848197 RepID=A0A918C2B0_9DEIO|nr:HAMP domain-containing sensor histidine kinase [Deinococcus ruber]GGR03180.1 two-component sensor histidine kinase [Deinococcus ruber]